MKKTILLLIITCGLLRSFAQLNIGSNANWVTTGNATVVLSDLNLVNNGAISAGTGNFKFTGTSNSTVNGSNLPSFYILEVAKSNAANIVLERTIQASSSIVLTSGKLDLNGNNILLSQGANVSGETETNRIIGPNGGFIEITQNLNSPNGSNPGNLGASITSTANLGLVTIRRGHTAQNGTGLATGINRYYSIMPANNTGLNATLRFKYFDAELNGQSEPGLVMYQSNDNGINWNNLSQTNRNSSSNYVEKTGIQSLSLHTLANDVQSGNGVTGLSFTGTRKRPTEVQLKWTTQTETNMSGYQVQRKLDNEADFSDRGFVNTLAPGGNSISQLNYIYTDVNAHNGNSHYRLKIITADNSFTYSDVITVGVKGKGNSGNGGGNGGGNGNGNRSVEAGENNAEEFAANVPARITVGPNPNNGNFWFTVTGIEKETSATLYTIDGRVIRNFKVVNQQQYKVNGLSNGIYLLKVPGMDAFKVVVQARGNSAVGTSTPSNPGKHL